MLGEKEKHNKTMTSDTKHILSSLPKIKNADQKMVLPPPSAPIPIPGRQQTILSGDDTVAMGFVCGSPPRGRRI